MTKKKIVALFFISVLIIGIYVLLFHKNKQLKYHPNNADIVVLLDVKNISQHYLYQFLTHPSEWQKKSGEKSDKTNFLKSGVKIPDFVEIFHLKNADFADWYSVLELSDREKFSSYLKQENFESIGENTFRKNKIVLKIFGEKCLIKIGSNQNSSDLDSLAYNLFSDKVRSVSATQFIADSHASISFLSGNKISSSPIQIGDNEITINNENQIRDFDELLQNLLKRNNFIEAKLDAKTLKNVTPFLNNRIKNSAELFPLIEKLILNTKIVEEKDTIVTYEYDDNFNEVEKVSFQNLLQPKYQLILQSSNPEKLQSFFHKQNWISAQNEFLPFPFQPSVYSASGNTFLIKSKNATFENPLEGKANYFFIKNNEKLILSFSSISKSEKEQLLNLSYLFLESRNNLFFGKIQFQKEETPLILRF